MRHRRIGQLMTDEVVIVRGDTLFKVVARTLSQHQVTAVCARPEWTMTEAARLIEARRVTRLVVVDVDEHLLGILSADDTERGGGRS